MGQIDRTSEIALLLTFLNDSEVKDLARNSEFQDHVLSQKNLIADLLKNGFALKSTVSPQTREVQTRIVAAAPPVSVYKPVQKTVVPEAATATASATVADPATVRTEVTKIFAEKTGYPVDMLEPELDLEADLGIDTVKQMEILGLVRKNFSIKLREGFSLKQTPNINSVVTLVLQG